MKAMDLLVGFGSVKDSYVIGAEEFRQGKHKVQIKRLSTRKVWLIAAAISIALLLVGCAVVYVLSLQDMKMGESNWEDHNTGETQSYSVLSLQGIAGSPSFQAAKEWYEWKQSYDPNSELLLTPDADAYADTLPESYQGYLIYTPEMKAEVDMLCAKYDLKLLGKDYRDTTTEDMFQTLQIGSIFRPNAPVEPEWSDGSPGYFFANGAFEIEVYVTLTEDASPWPYPNLIAYRCHRKDTFDDVAVYMTDIEHYQQWNYKNADGVECLLAVHPENGALIAVDKTDYFITVRLESKGGNILDGEITMDKQALETFADVFNFTIQPKPVTEEALAAVDARMAAYWEAYNQRMEQAGDAWQETLGVESYAGRVKYHLENSIHSYREGYTFYDLDGNGSGELLIGLDGYIRYIYSEKDGETAEILGWTSQSPTYLAEDGTLVSFANLENTGEPDFAFFHVENGERVMDKTINFNPERAGVDSSWWLEDYHSSSPYAFEISEEEFWQIANSKKRVVLSFRPLREYPLEQAVNCPANLRSTLYDDEMLRRDYGDANYSTLIRHQILSSTEGGQGELSDFHYALIDLDGDGQDELLLDEIDRQKIYTMADGKLYRLVYSDVVNICQGNIVETVHTYSGNNKTYCYFRKEGDSLIMVDYLRYDVESNLDNPWFRSADASGQDISMEPISRAEFDAIRGRFTPVELEWKPISEFPMD